MNEGLSKETSYDRPFYWLSGLSEEMLYDNSHH